MKPSLRVHVHRRAFDRLAALSGEVSERAVQAFGTIYARALAAMTPPHMGKGKPAEVLRSKNQRDLVKLREIISLNIAGVKRPEDIKPNARPVPFRSLSGAWLALDPAENRPAKPSGCFGMFVPTSWKKVRGQKVPESSPAQVYKSARWDGKKMVPTRRKRHFVRAAALKALVKQQQKHAGKLVSGWAEAARLFSTGKNVAAGFFVELGGKGFARKRKNADGVSRGFMVNRQPYSAAQAAEMKRRMPAALGSAKSAREAQIKAITRWYKHQAKKIFGVG